MVRTTKEPDVRVKFTQAPETGREDERMVGLLRWLMEQAELMEGRKAA